MGVVATQYGDGWSEADLVVRRVCGALACQAEVELLVPGPAPPVTSDDGAVRVVRFPAAGVEPARALALRRSLLGPQAGDQTVRCGCTDIVRRQLAAALPIAAQEALLLVAGGYSPELLRRLAAPRYDVVVFAGYDNASTYWGLEALDGRRPSVLLPIAVDDPRLWSPAVGDILEGADRIVVTTSCEEDVIRGRAPGVKPDQVRNAGFVVQVNGMARRAPAFGFDGRPTLVVARDWGRDQGDRFCLDGLLQWCDALRDHFSPRLAVRLTGPGTQRLPRRLRAESAGSRTDVWRWMAHALAVLDPEPQRVLGREVLESMLFATPVIVPAGGGATRLHAESGDGGLWYRSYEELRACVGALLDDSVRTALGRQGKAYASDVFGSTQGFVDRVCDVVLGLV